jgi:hypothetical protein
MDGKKLLLLSYHEAMGSMNSPFSLLGIKAGLTGAGVQEENRYEQTAFTALHLAVECLQLRALASDLRTVGIPSVL